MKKNQGSALLTVLATMAIVLVFISVSCLVVVINAKMNLAKVHSQKAYFGAEALIQDTALRFVRSREISNPYPDWTSNCLQLQDFDCKMDLNLTAAGGVIDAWGRAFGKVRHLQLELDVAEDESVTMSARKEIF